MIKHVNGWEISRKLQGNCKAYVKHFSAAKTKCMKDYIKHLQRENSDHYILHVGTNDLCLDRSPELIAKSIIILALTLKSESHDVSVSNIIVSNIFEDIFNKQQCGFRKGYNTQQCLLKMLEKWKRSVDQGKVFGALLTDLSKAFDCLDHELLIAKLNAYGFSLPALRLINDYLSNRRQRTRIGNSFSDWFEVILGVPQGSILGPL